MNVVSAVANLVKEKDYYKTFVEEAKAVIKQLSEGPGEVEYIHPLDFAEVFQSITVVDVFRQGELYEFPKTGKLYKQSILVPRKSSVRLSAIG